MTRRVALPTETEVREALTKISAAEPRRRPTVVALASSLGLSNATFWRHFPQVAREVADARRSDVRSAESETSTAGDTDANSAVRLRSEKARLFDQLEVAVAHIQHLTLENHALREQLEEALKVARIPSHR